MNKTYLFYSKSNDKHANFCLKVYKYADIILPTELLIAKLPTLPTYLQAIFSKQYHKNDYSAIKHTGELLILRTFY